MDVLNKDYLSRLINSSKQSLNNKYNFSIVNFSEFEVVNCYLIYKAINLNRFNLLISTLTKDNILETMLPAIMVTSLHCFIKNCNEYQPIEKGDIILSMKSGKVSVVKENIDSRIRILPLGTTRRIELESIKDYIQLSPKFEKKLNEIKSKKQRIKNFECKRMQEVEEFKLFFDLIKNNELLLPYKNKNKVVIIASKNDIVPKIPNYIPFQYINKNGESSPDTSFDPLLIITNDFNTVKEFIIEKEITIDTILFFGDTKYKQNIAEISRSYRHKKYVRCIFVGNQDVETSDNFTIMKWNWTLPEIKYVRNQQYQNIKPEIITHNDLSNATIKFVSFLNAIELKYENIVNFKPLLKFIRKVYSITSIGNIIRIKERANEILSLFENEADEVFQEEYYKIDTDYTKDLEDTKQHFNDILWCVKNSNAKELWFQNSFKVDCIVVPKSLKKQLEKEIHSCLSKNSKAKTLNSFENLTDSFIKFDDDLNNKYVGLKATSVISVSEFLKKGPNNNTHIFLSLYSNGMYTDILLQKILISNHKTKILCYPEEAKALKMYLERFQKEDYKELYSKQRELLCGIKYPEDPYLDTYSNNIEEWILHLIGLDDARFSRADEIKYEILFDDETKTIERDSKRVYVDGTSDEPYKEICHLQKGDNVRIYHNPDKETLHILIQITDQELFNRAEFFSQIWKNALKKYFKSKESHFSFDMLFNELKSNGLSVDKNRLEHWLKDDCKTKFPQKKRDILAITKTTNDSELSRNIQNIFTIKTTYSGRLVKAGVEFSEEINTYIISKVKGKMLKWLSDEHIEQIVAEGAPLRKIKSIQLIDEEISE